MARRVSGMVTDPIDLDQNWLRRFRRNLRRWYDQHARDLPWRRTTNPFRIWISEIMLQQTTVAAVVPYFRRFLKRFPTVRKLAAASEHEVLRYWEGLGYYSRARNIHKTARLIVEANSGRFPDDVDLLVKLPGIGRYTAGAIASFAFDQRAPIVEANTLRLYSRLLGYRGEPRSNSGQRLLWDFAECILPRKASGRFNQALMELGATICTPNDPDCDRCPVRSCCTAFADGSQAEIPRPAIRPDIAEVTEASVAIWNQDAYLLCRRGDGERWAGLWDFPRCPISVDLDAKLVTKGLRRKSTPSVRLRKQLEKEVFAMTGLRVQIDHVLTTIRHGVTRFRITLHCFRAEYRTGKLNGRDREARWVRPDQFPDYPLSVTGRRLARLLANLE